MALVTNAECGAWVERLRHERWSQEEAYLPPLAPSPFAPLGQSKGLPTPPASAASAASGVSGRGHSRGGRSSTASRQGRSSSSSTLRHTTTEMMGLERRGAGGVSWAHAGTEVRKQREREQREREFRRSRSASSLAASSGRH
uniref:Uncharacterized protein n=1 Tax=Alexandrium catenella TaxID=2925 RepID=A0A7S1LBX1_ALECA|mmetsp:Transcript_110257/g.292843  ORF Transcript_110257/g.292843 Transcript_110257/m.292843 type:complete len:142 (+) Transcript_110257:3-428(+)